MGASGLLGGGAARRRIGGLRQLLVQRLEGPHREEAAHHEAGTEGRRGAQREQRDHGGVGAPPTPVALRTSVAAAAATQPVDRREEQQAQREAQGQALGRVSDGVYQSVHHDGSPSVNSKSVAALRALPTSNYTPLFLL